MATTFEYRARDAAGTEQRGTTRADSTGAVARELAGRGWVPVDIREQSAHGPAAAAAAGDAAAKPRRARGGRRQQQAMGLLLRELASLLRAGVPLMRALRLAADSSDDAELRAALGRISRDLDNGHNLVSAVEHEHRASGLLSAYDVAMLQVGEQTGRLPEAFLRLHRQREFDASTQEQVVTALRYPAFVILTCVMAAVIVNLWVIPSFARVFAQARAELPLLTQLLLQGSNLMIRGWPVLLAGTAALAFGVRRWLDTPGGRLAWDRHKLRLPIVGPILEGIVLARLASSLASALSAGLTLSDALGVTGRTLGNRWHEARLQGMCTELARGTSITASARNMGVLPPIMLQMFAIGEESGALEELMAEISLHYQTEVDTQIRRLSATIEPLLIWILGIGVLVLALGIFLPMWDLGRATLR